MSSASQKLLATLELREWTQRQRAHRKAGGQGLVSVHAAASAQQPAGPLNVRVDPVQLPELDWVAARLGVTRDELIRKYLSWGMTHDRGQLPGV